ncbi:MAG: Glycine hydroxymethyltransferase [Candidatus Moranbacteria bacterium GW2011_GWC1_45_18]|nr:MAG: Serine hydroxymethyltransferase [Candidatus Moranbacteria bacterium GW2011_GWC2_40_12]KKT32403.1 MAG: Serine hydroxymethyltransferase [Candidatus Moranbacteria bacterium GW2011_GWF2_44_10]KKT69564.1 MAG: Serine hydroxymethyltransferase [Candidatus Moranbacteria bacterium GW2011_GWF1_44_4]KKT99953.1 MAG: Glycine hydroxymethyltransferase [Candidatus Moranbacteria bacterium GW2011_GWC1_45_18]OGI39275.1 MAG: serine hydroxymethyltransferase [Candidatus Moranbacteria bacterium RIFOXYB1_FULL_4
MDANKNWRILQENDPKVYDALIGEEKREQKGVELIPSENYTYPEVFAANGSILTNKYAEGYPGKRYYGGQEYTDIVENLARDRAKKLFRCEHANVQPLSGSPMNQAVYFAFLEPGDTVLAMELSHGGHLTHGAPVSHMGKVFNFVRYKTHPDEKGRIDFKELLKVAKDCRPKIVMCGYTSYPRDYDYADFKKVADEVGAMTFADVAHIGGLIAAGVMRNPFDYGFDVVSTTTHKSLRGPRAGMIMCKKEHADAIDKSVFPGLQGGPHMQTVAAIAAALGKALEPEFKEYGKQVLANSKTLAEALMESGVKLVTDGTDNHMMVANTMQSFGIDGKLAEQTLDKISITVNKQIIPDDPNPPLRPSGIRLGTPAATTRGMKEDDMKKLGIWIVGALKNDQNESKLKEIKKEVESFCAKFPVPGL